MPTRTIAALASALATALLAACSRDVTLPPEPTAPRISSIAPAAAYAGQRITIVASGLDAVADANAVQFPFAVARGASVSGGALVVEVPADAGSGAITVQASGGVSAPSSEPFTYLGLGQLRSGAVSGEVPLLHKPYRILAVGGDTFLHSDLLLALVRYSAPAFVRDLAVSADALPWSGGQGAVAWLESEWNEAPAPDVSRLVRLDLATGTAVTWDAMAFAGMGPIVAMRGPAASPADDRIAVLRSTGTEVWLALHDADTLAELQAPKVLPGVAEVRGCADGGEGQLACIVRAASGGPLALARVTPGDFPAVDVVALPDGDVVQDDPIDLDDPICAGRTLAAGRIAAVALDDGRVALATLDGPGPAFWRDVDTGSRTPARSLACAALGPHLAVLAPKRADDLVVAVDVEIAPAGQIRWSADVARASRVAADAAAATVHVSGEADNRVVVLDAATGALLARRSFDVLPGRDGAVQGAAWITADETGPVALVLAVGSPPGVVELPLTAAPGTFPIYRNRPDAVGVFGPFAPYDPAYRWYFTIRDQGASQGGTTWDLGSAAQIGQDGPNDAYVGTSDGLATLLYDGGWTGQRETSPIAGATFVSMGLLPGRRVFAAVGDASGGWTVRAWSEVGAAAGGSAEQSWTSPGPIAGAALLDGVLWAFHDDGAGAFVASRLDEDLRLAEAFPMAERFDRVLAVSPNGRTFLTSEHQPWSRDTSVVVWAAAGGGGWERVATVPVQGAVSGVAFGGTGEALYVLTRSPDRVVVLE